MHELLSARVVHFVVAFHVASEDHAKGVFFFVAALAAILHMKCLAPHRRPSAER